MDCPTSGRSKHGGSDVVGFLVGVLFVSFLNHWCIHYHPSGVTKAKGKHQNYGVVSTKAGLTTERVAYGNILLCCQNLQAERRKL